MNTHRVFLILILLFNISAFSQVIETKASDTLQKKSYEELEKAFEANRKDSVKILAYATIYLLKAKKENNTIKIADGYYLFFRIHKLNLIGVQYSDSIIQLTKTLNHKDYPAKGYLAKGYYYYKIGDYKTSFDNHLEALNYASARNNIDQLFEIKHFSGVIKERLGENAEALALFEEYLSFVKEYDFKEKYKNDYMIALFSLADSYRRNNKLDTAMAMAKEGIHVSLKNKNNNFYHLCMLSSGMIYHDNGNYTMALDSLHKATKYLETSTEKTNLAIGYLYLGKTYHQIKQPIKAVSYLKKVDSILKKYPKLLSDFREGYEYLIDYYKAKDDKETIIFH